MSISSKTWQSGEVVVNNGVRIHFTRTGTGDRPPLVLAHGFSDDGLCWTPVAEALEADYDILMVDARGHGLSEAPSGGYGAAEQAADLAGVIPALGLSRPIVLGHSMGAMTALMLAGTYPDVPGAILLEDPPQVWVQGTKSPEPASPPPAPSPVPSWITALEGKTREELISEQRVKTPHWSEGELGPWADAKLHFIPKAGNRSPGVPVDWPAVVRAITCPVLLITGDPEQGALVKPEGVEALKALLPTAQSVFIAGAGHSIRRDQFDSYLSAIRAFLANLG